jgi:peptidoglycan/xylan/chitin deacetylase (PgdA/CDA1 family)
VSAWSAPVRRPRSKHAPVAAAVKNDAPPEILLTFDDGPAVGKTPKILDILDARGIKAVFFVVGRRLEGHSVKAEESRALIREELRRGHAVGNHTIHHYFLCGRTYAKQATTEIEGNAQLIQDATGVRPDLFRTPYGAHCRPLRLLLAGLGITPIGWNIDPQDWKLRNAPKIEAYVEKHLAKLHGRAIVLFHDIQAATVTALPHILDWIDQENTRRVATGKPPIKILNYLYLLPERRLVPPLLDALGRVLVRLTDVPMRSPVRFWPAEVRPLAWPAGRV